MSLFLTGIAVMSKSVMSKSVSCVICKMQMVVVPSHKVVVRVREANTHKAFVTVD